MKKKIQKKLRINVLNRDSYKCLWCGRGNIDGVTLDIDHVFAEIWGGKTTYENLGTLCSHCNRAKGVDCYGSYLLSTIFKAKNLERWFEDEFVGHNIERDGDLHKWKIKFYRKQNDFFQQEVIEHEYFMGGMLLATQGNPDTDIRIAERRNKALLEFKDKIRDFLFENKCFLEELNGKLIFRERK